MSLKYQWAYHISLAVFKKEDIAIFYRSWPESIPISLYLTLSLSLILSLFSAYMGLVSLVHWFILAVRGFYVLHIGTTPNLVLTQVEKSKMVFIIMIFYR